MTELETLFQYLSFAVMLFFVTFFLSIFYQYVKYKSITPRKMLTFEKGGLFEHYKVVGAITLGLFLVHGLFDVSPFRDSLLAFFIDLTLNFMFISIFLIFLFVFISVLVVYLYARFIKKIEDKATYINHKMIPIINSSMIAGIIGAAALILLLLLNVPIDV